MAELSDAVDQLAQNLIANNIAALMPSFTPQGLMQALVMQAQPDSAEGSDEYEITPEGDDRFRIWFRGDDGEGAIYTEWQEVDGVWKVNAIGRLED